MAFTLSLAMIVRNEERMIERVLASARPVCDEMVVVDTGSTDRTVELAEQMGAKVFHFAWVDDFSAARNFSFERCTCDWIMFLDADDVLPIETQAKIRAMKAEGVTSDIDVFEMVYNYEHDAHGRCIESHLVPRLVRRRKYHRWENPVHEYLFYYPSRARKLEDVFVEHRQDVSLTVQRYDRVKRILAAALARGEDTPQTLFYHAHHLFLDKDWREASVYFQKYLDKVGMAALAYDALVRISLCAIELGDWSTALARVREAEQIDPERAEALVLIGSYHVSQNEWDEAIPYFQRAVSLSRPHGVFVLASHYAWVPWDFLSRSYAAKGDFIRAADCAAKALTFGMDSERIEANLRLFRARSSELLGTVRIGS